VVNDRSGVLKSLRKFMMMLTTPTVREDQLKNYGDVWPCITSPASLSVLGTSVIQLLEHVGNLSMASEGTEKKIEGKPTTQNYTHKKQKTKKFSISSLMFNLGALCKRCHLHL
jgi:hypothetical protein